MGATVQVYRATVDPANVPRLLEIRPQAIAAGPGGLRRPAAGRTDPAGREDLVGRVDLEPARRRRRTDGPGTESADRGGDAQPDR